MKSLKRDKTSEQRVKEGEISVLIQQLREMDEEMLSEQKFVVPIMHA